MRLVSGKSISNSGVHVERSERDILVVSIIVISDFLCDVSISLTNILAIAWIYQQKLAPCCASKWLLSYEYTHSVHLVWYS